MPGKEIKNIRCSFASMPSYNCDWSRANENVLIEHYSTEQQYRIIIYHWEGEKRPRKTSSFSSSKRRNTRKKKGEKEERLMLARKKVQSFCL